MNRIFEFRARQRIAQKTLAQDMGWKPDRLCRFETGRALLVLDDCRAIVGALNARGVACTLDDVFPPEPVTSSDSSAAA
ncbi:transcriptional regulator [Pseudomonas sp. NPDC086581]|uniref:transcriptional regulator n=1 Tax=Pseudomonas sp. NPDC086581 TaxID=3364432 RepID=UPI00380FBAF0